jgi:hypothetical protein
MTTKQLKSTLTKLNCAGMDLYTELVELIELHDIEQPGERINIGDLAERIGVDLEDEERPVASDLFVALAQIALAHSGFARKKPCKRRAR